MAVSRFKKVTPGRDFGTQVEILTGIDAGARVITNPSDALREGTPVEIPKPAAK